MLKYTIAQKIGSIIKNLIIANWKDILNYIISRINKRFSLNVEVTFSGDITKESDYDPRDYTLSSAEADKLPEIIREKLYMIDQGRAYRTRNACVPFNIYLQICNNLNIKPNYTEALQWLNWAESKRIWAENAGASIPVLVKAMCKRWNTIHPDRKIRYDRLYYSNQELQKALKKGYEVTGGRNTFSAYTKDKADGKIDFSTYRGWKRAGGHCLNIMLGSFIKRKTQIEIQPNNTEKRAYAPVKSEKLHCVNSYPTRQGKLNIYEHSRLNDHCKNSIWYSWFYLIYEADPKPTKPTIIEVPTIRKSAQIAMNRGIWNGKGAKDPVTREDTATMVNRGIEYAIKNKK